MKAIREDQARAGRRGESIEFPEETVRAVPLEGVEFAARYRGNHWNVIVTRAALNDYCGGVSGTQQELLKAYELAKPRIHAAARRMLAAAPGNIVIGSSDLV